MNHVNRRRFLKWLGMGAFGLSVNKFLKPSSAEPDPSEENDAVRIRKYNPLGKTGLKVSDVSFGAINYFNPNVLRYAYDLGVNLFDTAEGYMRTMSETYLGQALKNVRHNVVISTKHVVSSPQIKDRNAHIARVEESLKRLETDYIDIALLHNVSDPSLLENEDVLSAYAQLKKDGKIRFTGFSTHVAQEIFPKLLELNFYDVTLFIYNHLEGKSFEPLIEQVRKKGIGTIAMKTLAGNKQGSLKSLVNEQLKYSQAAIRWVLANPHMDCCVITMNTFSHVEEYVKASGKPLEKADLEAISKYQSEAGSQYCRVSCRECLSSCPRGVAINDVLRYRMYYEDYRLEKSALQLYAEMEKEKKPLSCGDCPGFCTDACPFGLSVKERLIHSHRLLSA